MTNFTLEEASALHQFISGQCVSYYEVPLRNSFAILLKQLELHMGILKYEEELQIEIVEDTPEEPEPVEEPEDVQ